MSTVLFSYGDIKHMRKNVTALIECKYHRAYRLTLAIEHYLGYTLTLQPIGAKAPLCPENIQRSVFSHWHCTIKIRKQNRFFFHFGNNLIKLIKFLQENKYKSINRCFFSSS